MLANLILDVKNLDRSLEFYHTLLRLPIRNQEEMDGHRLARLNTGLTELTLVEQPVEDQNPLLDRTGGMVINFRVRDLPKVATDLLRNHVNVLRGLEMALWGERTLLITDPDGYAILLSEPVEVMHHA